eukprot:gene16009-19047_t
MIDAFAENDLEIFLAAAKTHKKAQLGLGNLTRKYPVDLSKADELDKCLSIVDIVAYGVGSTVGAGVFVSIGVAIKLSAGPSTAISFVLSAIACLISAFCYSEFAASIPLSGSAYTFSYVALGEFFGWFAAAVARGWAGYLGQFWIIFGDTAPEWVSGITTHSSLFNISVLSPIIVIICTVILVFGVKDSSRFNLVITGVNITTILFFIIFGSFYIDVANYNPFFLHGASGVFQGCSKIFFSYVGFDSVTTLAGEVKNPKRDLPIGIIGTLIIATTLYVGVTLVLSGMVAAANVSMDSPLSDVFLFLSAKHPHLKWVALVIVCGTLTSLSASTLCSLLGQPRIYLQMAKDGLIFERFSSVSKKSQVPVFGTIFTGVFASLLAMLLSLEMLTDMISIGTLLAFTVGPDGRENHLIKSPILLFAEFVFSCAFGLANANNLHYGWQIGLAVPIVIIIGLLMIRKQVNIPTTFKCPLSPLLPCLGIFFNTFFIMNLDYQAFIRIGVWTVLGVAIYLIYGIRYSKLNDLPEKNEDEDDLSHSSSGSVNN